MSAGDGCLSIYLPSEGTESTALADLTHYLLEKEEEEKKKKPFDILKKEKKKKEKKEQRRIPLRAAGTANTAAACAGARRASRPTHNKDAEVEKRSTPPLSLRPQLTLTLAVRQRDTAHAAVESKKE